MTKTIEDLFIYLRFATDFFIVVLSLVSIKKIQSSKDLAAISFYCLFDFLFAVTIYFANIHHDVIAKLFALFTLVEYSIFSFFIWSHIKNPVFKKGMMYASLLFITFLVIYSLTTAYRSIDSIPVGFETILILVCSFYFLYEQMNDTTTLFIYSRYPFWFIAGFMIYLSGSFFIYIFANQVDKDILNEYWYLTNALYVLMILLFGVGFYRFLRKKPGTFPISHSPNPYLN
jgi:hypothetical protein